MMMFAATFNTDHTFEDPVSTFPQHHNRSNNNIQDIQHIHHQNSTDTMTNPKRQHKRSNSLSALISFNLDLDEETEPSTLEKNDDEDVAIDLSAASKHIIGDAQLWAEFQRRLRESKKKTHSSANAQQILIDIIQEYNGRSSEMATSDHNDLPRLSKPKSKVERAPSAAASRSSDNISSLARLASDSSTSTEKSAFRRRATMDTLFTSYSVRSCKAPENSNNSKEDTSKVPIIIRKDDDNDDSKRATTCSSTSWSPPSAKDILNRNETSNRRQSSFSGRIAQLVMRTRLSLANEEVDLP